METVWLIVFVVTLVAVVAAIRLHWRREIRGYLTERTEDYIAFCDDSRIVRFIGFDVSLLRKPVSERIAAKLLPLHLFSLGVLVGAGLVLRLGQLVLPREVIDLPLWALGWIVFVGFVWLAVALAEHRQVLAPRALMGDWDPLAGAAVIHAITSRHRLALLAFAALGLPAHGPATLAVLSGVGASLFAIYWWPTLGRDEPRWIVIPSELARPFLSFKDQVREGLWVMPTGLLLLVGAAALLHFRDVNSLVVASVIAAGCGIVMYCERVSRLHAQKHTLTELRAKLASFLSSSPALAPMGTATQES